MGGERASDPEANNDFVVLQVESNTRWLPRWMIGVVVGILATVGACRPRFWRGGRTTILAFKHETLPPGGRFRGHLVSRNLVL